MKYKVKNTVFSSFLPAYKIQAKKIFTALVVSYIKFKLKNMLMQDLHCKLLLFWVLSDMKYKLKNNNILSLVLTDWDGFRTVILGHSAGSHGRHGLLLFPSECFNLMESESRQFACGPSIKNQTCLFYLKMNL